MFLAIQGVVAGWWKGFVAPSLLEKVTPGGAQRRPRWKESTKWAGGLRGHRPGKNQPTRMYWHTLVFREDPEAYAGSRGLATKEATGRGSMRAQDWVQQVWTCERQRTRAVRRCQGQGGPVWLREKRLSLTTRGIRSAIPRIQGDGGATLRGRRALLGQTWRLDKGVWSWSCFSSSICTLKKKLSRLP